MITDDYYNSRQVDVLSEDESEERVTAELKYNPYLSETEIWFNNKKPRINSLVENFHDANLHDWIMDLPEIFKNEMNGYDFILEFTGTELDCKEIELSFEKAGVSKGEVEVFHKGNLEERTEKEKRVRTLLGWFEDNPNQSFNLQNFKDIYPELYDTTYPMKILQSDESNISVKYGSNVSAEYISNLDELDNTVFGQVPVIVVVEEKTLLELQAITKFFKKRTDVADNQMYFIIDKKLNADIVRRTIHDLGFEHPQVIAQADDEAVEKYIEIYPETEYINCAINAFREVAGVMKKRLEQENKEGEKKLSDNQRRINAIEKEIADMKKADSLLLNKDNIGEPSDYRKAKAELLGKIANWRKKKTKITQKDEAKSLSVELSKEVTRDYEAFSEKAASILEKAIKVNATNVRKLYLEAAFDSGFLPEGVNPNRSGEQHIPRIDKDLLELKSYLPIKRKEQILFFIPGNNSNNELEYEITYYTQKWRDYAIDIIEQMADELIQRHMLLIQNHADRLAEAYHYHLTELIDSKLNEKENVSQNLSDEEKQIQNDKKWLNEFEEQLRKIERD